jgi:hypothetical protein
LEFVRLTVVNSYSKPNYKPQTNFVASNNYFSIPIIPFILIVQTGQIVNFIAMKKRMLALLLLPFAAIAQRGEDSVMIKKISDEILRNGKAYDLLYQLTKQIGGRLAGSPQSVKAEQWGKEAMEKNGADNVWLQECTVPHWVRGGQDIAVITEVNNSKTSRRLDVLALGNSLGSNGTFNSQCTGGCGF